MTLPLYQSGIRRHANDIGAVRNQDGPLPLRHHNTRLPAAVLNVVVNAPLLLQNTMPCQLFGKCSPGQVGRYQIAVLRFINALDRNHEMLRAMRPDFQAGATYPYWDGFPASQRYRLQRALMRMVAPSISCFMIVSAKARATSRRIPIFGA